MGFVSDYVAAVPGAGLVLLHLFVQISFVEVLQELSGAFMPGKVILFSVVLRAGPVGVGRKVPVFSSYLL
ncbi:MAG TPA: hypothetical protein VMQ86_22420 [Bryobacteraceae bacterium]|jgi:hypothetical protein|nr:hypothetical protein [Bryobacteraceae bacterium]